MHGNVVRHGRTGGKTISHSNSCANYRFRHVTLGKLHYHWHGSRNSPGSCHGHRIDFHTFVGPAAGVGSNVSRRNPAAEVPRRCDGAHGKRQANFCRFPGIVKISCSEIIVLVECSRRGAADPRASDFSDGRHFQPVTWRRANGFHQDSARNQGCGQGFRQQESLKWIVPLALGILVLVMPRPEGLTPAAWHFFALFIAVIAALITEPFQARWWDSSASHSAAPWCLSARRRRRIELGARRLSNSTVWLIYAASLFALGYEVTGLGRRIALALVHKLGGKTLGLGYAVALSDLVLAPFTSSNTARASSVFPIVSNIPPLYGSSPTENPRKIGSYIMWTAFAAQCVTSSMFLTALAPNVLAVELARKIRPCRHQLDRMVLRLPSGRNCAFSGGAPAQLHSVSAGVEEQRGGSEVGGRAAGRIGQDYAARNDDGDPGDNRPDLLDRRSPSGFYRKRRRW